MCARASSFLMSPHSRTRSLGCQRIGDRSDNYFAKSYWNRIADLLAGRHESADKNKTVRETLKTRGMPRSYRVIGRRMHKPAFRRIYASCCHCWTWFTRVNTTVYVLMSIVVLVASEHPIGLRSTPTVLGRTLKNATQLVAVIHVFSVRIVAI